MKTNPKMRDLADLTERTEKPERLREQIEADAAATRPLDPYGEHAMQIGPTRVFDPATKGFRLKPAATCSCRRLSVAGSSDLEVELAVQVHALEITVCRLARFVGLDLTTAPSALERAKGGDPAAIAALEARDEILRGKLAEQGVDVDAISTELVDEIRQAVDAEDVELVDRALNGTGTLPPQGIATITAKIDADVSHVADVASPEPLGEPLGPGSFEGTWQGVGDLETVDDDVLRGEFLERAAALGLDGETLHAEAEDLASENPISLDAARERVLADAIRGIGTNGGALATSSSTDDGDEPTREAPLEGSLWVCKACQGRNEQSADRCAGCDAEIPESPDYVVPLDPAVAHAMLGENHPLVRAEKGIRDTNPDERAPAWDAEQVLATGGTLPEAEDGES